MNYSEQRNIINEVVNASCDHPNADTVLARAKEIMPSINLATVYRNLATLSNAGKILRISVSDGDRFDKTLIPHAHFHCVNCGKLTDVELCLGECVKEVENNSGCSVNKVDIVFSGICNDCISKK